MSKSIKSIYRSKSAIQHAVAAVEVLDSRRLFSASLAGGILNVVGTAGNDIISLNILGATLRVVDNGVNRDFAAAAVTQINVGLAGGNDKFTSLDTITKPTNVNAGVGNDTITTGGGNDTVLGDFGFDVIDGRNGSDSLSGGQDNDTVSGGTGADTILGNSGDDLLWAFRNAHETTTGGDKVYGGDGNDTLNGSFANDSLYGEGG